MCSIKEDLQDKAKEQSRLKRTYRIRNKCDLFY